MRVSIIRACSNLALVSLHTQTLQFAVLPAPCITLPHDSWPMRTVLLTAHVASGVTSHSDGIITDFNLLLVSFWCCWRLLYLNWLVSVWFIEWKNVLLSDGPTCSVIGRGGPSTTEIARSKPSGVMGKSCKLSSSAEAEDSSVN
jgi:hypothetical protein